MHDNDSKKLWLELEKEIRREPMIMGPYTTQTYLDDPCALAFITSRYKFCAKILRGKRKVLEVGCGDGFGSALVAQHVSEVVATDINKDLILDNTKRLARYSNVSFEYHDFRDKAYSPTADGVYLVDVFEHIYPSEEPSFLCNILSSINTDGVCIIGTPNKTAEIYASPYSRRGHINLKDHEELMAIGEKYFRTAFLFGMNDEVVHTGFPQMAHFLWLIGVGPKTQSS